MAYFDLGKLNLAQPIVLKAFVSTVTAILTDVLKRHWIPPTSETSNSRLSKQGQVIRIHHTFTTATT